MNKSNLITIILISLLLIGNSCSETKFSTDIDNNIHNHIYLENECKKNIVSFKNNNGEWIPFTFHDFYIHINSIKLDKELNKEKICISFYRSEKNKTFKQLQDDLKWFAENNITNFTYNIVMQQNNQRNRHKRRIRIKHTNGLCTYHFYLDDVRW